MLKIKSGPPRRRQPTDEELAFERRLLAAQLVGYRIVSGISAKRVAERMGYLHYKHQPFYTRWWLRATQWYWVPRKVLKLEEGLSEGRFSTFQRYARVAGFRVDATLVKPRSKLSLQSRANQIKRRRRQQQQGKRPRRSIGY